MDYEEFNFKKLFPNNLINIQNKVFRTWNNFDKYKNDLDLKKIISCVIKCKDISWLDFSAIIYNIKKVEILIKNENLVLELFLSKISIDKKNDNVDIVALFEDIYDAFIIYYKNKSIENQLKNLIKKNIEILSHTSIKMEIYREYQKNNNTFFEFLFINIIENGLKKNRWKEKLRYYSINEERYIFDEITSTIFNNIIDYIKINEEFVDFILSNLIEKKTFEEKKLIFKEILNHYVVIDNIDFISDIWMKKILKIMGHPDKKTITWAEFKQEELEIIKRWLIKNRLEEIFTIEIKDEKRLEFWKRYISQIKRVEFYKELNQAIIMETGSHTFIEFGEKGNAFYAYELKELNIKMIEGFKKISLNRLKNRGDALIYLSHSGNWEYKFMVRLQKLGYEIKGKNYEYYK